MENLTIAFQITLVGMGLVFGAILLLWGLMALLVLLAPEKAGAGEGEAPEAVELSTAARALAERRLKEQAAAAAVALALAEREKIGAYAFPLPSTAFVSAWQLASRTKTLNRRGAVR